MSKSKHDHPVLRWFVLTGISVLISMLILIPVIWFFNMGRNNSKCDTGCLESNYAGGEIIPWMVHDMCICVPAKPGPAGYYMLKRSLL